MLVIQSAPYHGLQTRRSPLFTPFHLRWGWHVHLIPVGIRVGGDDSTEVGRREERKRRGTQEISFSVAAIMMLIRFGSKGGG